MTERFAFQYIAHADHMLRMLNLTVLMFVAFIPFQTAALMAYLSHPSERTVATALALLYVLPAPARRRLRA